MFPCRLIRTSPYHSSYYVSTSLNNLTKEGALQFITESKCGFVGIFCCVVFVFFFFFFKWLLPPRVLAHQANNALVTGLLQQQLWTELTDTQISVPLHHAVWHLFKGPSIVGCSTLQPKHSAQLSCTQVQLLHSPQLENISLTKASMKPNEPFVFRRQVPKLHTPYMQIRHTQPTSISFLCSFTDT